jgi:hypothetical protein
MTARFLEETDKFLKESEKYFIKFGEVSGRN